MKKSNLILFLIFFLSVTIAGCSSDVGTETFIIQSDSNITSLLNQLNCSDSQIVEFNATTDVWTCGEKSNGTGGSGDITEVNTPDKWLSGGKTTGAVDLYWNESVFNTTFGNASIVREGDIERVIVDWANITNVPSGLDDGDDYYFDTDTTWSILVRYLYNNSGNLDINETLLNETILALENNTDLYYPDTDTLWSILGPYLVNVSGSLVLNESVLNATIRNITDARDDTGSGGGGTNITVNITSTAFNGSQGGYNGSNANCALEFPGSHLCTFHEIVSFISRGSLYEAYSDSTWHSTGNPKYIPADVPVDDCNGWTYDGTTTHLGNYWKWNDNAYGGAGKAINCGTELKLACCTTG